MKTFLDTETTGLHPGHIAQLTYILTDDDLQIQKTENLFFKIPEGSMEEGAQEVHKLSEEKLQELSNGKSFSQNAYRILNRITSYNVCYTKLLRQGANPEQLNLQVLYSNWQEISTKLELYCQYLHKSS